MNRRSLFSTEFGLQIITGHGNPVIKLSHEWPQHCFVYINVDWINIIQTDATEPGKVILRGVNSEAEGSYKCEVSAEGTFHTDFAEANLTVIGKSINLISWILYDIISFY
jgi:hypothetical protein